MKTFSTLIGLALFIQIVFGAFWMMGGNAWTLFVPSALMLPLLLPFAPPVIAYGLQNTWQGFAAIQYLLRTPEKPPSLGPQIRVVREFLRGAYIAGALSTVLGFVVTLGHIDGKPEEIAHHVAASLTGIIHAILLSEGLWRPLKNRLEALNAAGSEPTSASPAA